MFQVNFHASNESRIFTFCLGRFFFYKLQLSVCKLIPRILNVRFIEDFNINVIFLHEHFVCSILYYSDVFIYFSGATMDRAKTYGPKWLISVEVHPSVFLYFQIFRWLTVIFMKHCKRYNLSFAFKWHIRKKICIIPWSEILLTVFYPSEKATRSAPRRDVEPSYILCHLGGRLLENSHYKFKIHSGHKKEWIKIWMEQSPSSRVNCCSFKKLTPFCGTKNSDLVLITARHLSISWAGWIESTISWAGWI